MNKITNMETGQQNGNKTVLPSEFIEKALVLLPERAKDVLIKRFDLDGAGRKTLEETGEVFKITRERVRQIEKTAIEKIKTVNIEGINEINQAFSEIISRHGGIMERGFFISKALEYYNKFITQEKQGKQEEKNIILILHTIDGIKQSGANDKFRDFLYTTDSSVKMAEDVINECKNIFTEEGHAMFAGDVFTKVTRAEFLAGKNITEDVFSSYLHLAQAIAQNPFSEWGLSVWPSISPKSVKDKSYLVMLHEKKPLHFKEIAVLIGRIWKKKKPVLAETVHNELIKNRQFVLIGRGIYALAEWGYERGAVRDIIKSVLVKANRPISREEIIKEVILQRMVKSGTIALNLKDENTFERTAEGLYKLKVKSS